jgi:hypothetical protein
MEEVKSMMDKSKLLEFNDVGPSVLRCFLPLSWPMKSGPFEGYRFAFYPAKLVTRCSLGCLWICRTQLSRAMVSAFMSRESGKKQRRTEGPTSLASNGFTEKREKIVNRSYSRVTLGARRP